MSKDKQEQLQQAVASESTDPIPIIINPNIDLNAQWFEEDEFIHTAELKRVLDIIQKIKGNINDYNPTSDDEVRCEHNTITLSGNRGSGKTSFLMSLKRHQDISDNVFFIIDPTRTEEKGHIFLNVVSRIREVVNKKFEEDTQEDGQYEEWNKCLKKLAAGMPLLDGIGTNLDSSDWYDSTFVMEKGLHNIESAKNLEKNFHRFIKKSLNILKEKVFYIAFDDVDTDFAKGWPVMETIRKYLTSPQLVIILSGDLDLYTLLIRKKQWKNFGKALLKNEYDKDILDYEEYRNKVSRLENQYLIKVLKPENRIILSPLLKKIDLNIRPFKVKVKDNLAGIKDYYISLLQALGISSYIGIETYYPFLASMPIRSQITLMKAYEKYKDDNLEENFIQTITDIFYTDLKTLKVEVWDLVNNIGFVNTHILRFLIENRLLDEGSQLLPKMGKEDVNGALTALGFIWRNRVMRKPAEIFDYIIRVSNVVNLTEKWGYKIKDETSIKDFILHSRVYHDYGLKKIASLQAAYIDTFLENDDDAPAFGFIPLKMLYSITKKRTKRRLDDIFKLDNKSSILDYLGYLPAFNVTGSLDKNQLYYSFNNILAATGELMLINDENVLDEFIKLTQFREFQRWQKGTSLAIRGKIRGDDNGDDDTITDNETTASTSEVSGLTDFITSVKTWKNKYTKIEIPPYLLGRIMVRTYYSFLRIDEKAPVAKQLHQQIICFLNAVLVEEYMEKETAKGLTLANPTGEDKIFINNLTFALSKNENLQLFDMIIKCPLINVFADLSILSDISGYKELFNEETNINKKLYELDTLINTPELSPPQDNTSASNTIVNLDDISTEQVSYNFEVTQGNARKIAKLAMLHGYRKRDFIDNKNLIKQIIRQLFKNNKVYDVRIVPLQQILSITNYALNGREWT